MSTPCTRFPQDDFPAGCVEYKPRHVSTHDCPVCEQPIPSCEWICAACLTERCAEASLKLYEACKQLINPNRCCFRETHQADMQEIRDLIAEIEEVWK